MDYLGIMGLRISPLMRTFFGPLGKLLEEPTPCLNVIAFDAVALDVMVSTDLLHRDSWLHLMVVYVGTCTRARDVGFAGIDFRPRTLLYDYRARLKGFGQVV